MSVSTNDIINYKHQFSIDEKEIELTINCKDGYWTSNITKGETGVGNCSGGVYSTLSDYIKAQEKQHRYCFHFYRDGHTYAKEMIQ